MENKKPIVTTLCGSRRFSKAFIDADYHLTLAGHIVLSIGNAENELTEESKLNDLEKRKLKAFLDVLHFRKIDLSDEIFVLNVDGYIGESTEREIEYAKSTGKKVRYLVMGKSQPQADRNMDSVYFPVNQKL
ncbi:MAG TPA: hypothetical protein VMU29_14970 [Smithella sp.]|nr:hypothetical protein [Smithella sp.]